MGSGGCECRKALLSRGTLRSSVECLWGFKSGLAKTTTRKGGKAGRRRDVSETLDVRYRSDIVGEEGLSKCRSVESHKLEKC